MEKKPQIITRQISNDFEEKLRELVENCRESGNLQVLMVAMAAVIQREAISDRHSEDLPYAGAIDNIMRAVEHTLRGDPTMNKYALQKLQHGHDCLRSWMNQSTDSSDEERKKLNEYSPNGAPH